VLLAVLTWPVGFCLLPATLNWDTPAMTVLAVFPQVAAVILGGFALRDTETNPLVGGRALAITGIATGAVATLLTAFVLLYPPPALW
jgi:hypothetical protein